MTIQMAACRRSNADFPHHMLFSHERTMNFLPKIHRSCVGLNVHGRITTEETNNTSDTYQIEIINKTNAVLTESTSTAPGVKATHIELNLTDWPSSAPSAYLTTVALTDANTQITYINQLNSVSPTGIVRHIAPYVMILGFAFFFAVLFRRRREETAEE